MNENKNRKQSLNRKEMPHNLVDYATKLWSKYAQRKDAYSSCFWDSSISTW